jgi:hypothetical protein
MCNPAVAKTLKKNNNQIKKLNAIRVVLKRTVE